MEEASLYVDIQLMKTQDIYDDRQVVTCKFSSTLNGKVLM